MIFTSKKRKKIYGGNQSTENARQVGVEPTTFCLGNRRSIHWATDAFLLNLYLYLYLYINPLKVDLARNRSKSSQYDTVIPAHNPSVAFQTATKKKKKRPIPIPIQIDTTPLRILNSKDLARERERERMEESIRSFCGSLSSFCNHVESSCDALKQSIDRRPIPLGLSSPLSVLSFFFVFVFSAILFI